MPLVALPIYTHDKRLGEDGILETGIDFHSSRDLLVSPEINKFKRIGVIEKSEVLCEMD